MLDASAWRLPPTMRRRATVGPSWPPSIRPARHRSPSESCSSFLKRMYGPNCSYGLLRAAMLMDPRELLWTAAGYHRFLEVFESTSLPVAERMRPTSCDDYFPAAFRLSRKY